MATAGLSGCSGGGGDRSGGGGQRRTATPSVIDQLRHAVTATPVRADERLYVPTYADGLYALDAATGAVQWRFGLSVTAGAVVDDGVVYVGDGGDGETLEQLMASDGRVYAIDAETGDSLWRADVQGNPVFEPVVRDDAVHFGARSYGLHTFDAASGESRESIPLDTGVSSGGVRIRDGVAYAGSQRRVLAVDLSSGDTRWELHTESEPRPIRLDGGRLYVGTDAGLRAVALDSGEPRWSTETGAATGPVVGAVVSAGLVDDPGVAGFDPETGQERWRLDLPARPQRPLLADGTLYVPTRDGVVHVVDAQTGTERRAIPVAGSGADSTAALGTGPQLSCSPARDGDTVYVGDESGIVYALDAEAGDVRWRTDLQAE